jgi:hypothetical protein
MSGGRNSPTYERIKMIITDTFIEIGSQHKVCEDYILKLDTPQAVIICDGCSSSKNTDMGARILSHVTKMKMQNNIALLKDLLSSSRSSAAVQQYGLSIIFDADGISTRLGLDETALDSTLIIAVKNPDRNSINVFFYGDGYLILKYKNDDIEVTKIDYDNNMPFYLSYSLNQDRLSQYVKSEMQKTISRMGMNQFKIKTPAEFRFIKEIPLDNIKAVMVSSDGMSSFIKKSDEVIININLFLDYPVKNGEFLKRTMNYHLTQLKKEDVNHYDDLSIGVFLVKE